MIDRMRADSARSLVVERDLDARVAGATEEKLGLEAKVVELGHQIETLSAVARNDSKNAAALLDAERRRLESELARALDESAALKVALDARESETPAAPSEPTADLRHQIQNLAAQVIRLTMLAEGPDGSVAKALAQPKAHDGSVVSLAERVRELQAADERKRRSSEV